MLSVMDSKIITSFNFGLKFFIITGTISGLLTLGSALFGWRAAENYATANELKEQERALYREMFPPGGEVRRHLGD